ncbi:sodium-dependent bicarbonate transport family permease [Shewanella sp. NIFS-20-20]|uniref:sodium-dependent bicarbonate transport family permease n=1 Tax=Shewanella sp. NIFS-20-20 TaxID=2853806 RepID=UPI001C464F19|nr:sodium-dependent bicarbonate transport family permease [Shewanella sp. NIFS-20-20]MBV7314683.1 sodium-dependent bicarbonate transport family permease [Shewanella sp. NIFS-20-20]
MPDIVIAFFALGLLAGWVKSDLKVPESIYETLSILLMLTLGVKGGMALHGHTDNLNLMALALIAALGIIIPLGIYPLLRRVIRLSQADAVSIAAHYGSVSAGTFAVVIAMAAHIGWPLAPETTLYLVLLELPAIIVMLWWHRFLLAKRVQTRGQNVSSGSILHEALTSRGVVLLVGGVIIGWAYGPQGLADITPVLLGGFKTLLALFLLEMGLSTAKVCRPLPVKHWRLMVFAALAPFALAWVGIGVGLYLALPAGSILVLAALTASSSYIAAPAAIKAAIPEANIGLAMLAALGITFPVNVLIGLPLYHRWISALLPSGMG